MSVEVKNLTKIFGEQRAVDDISFTVEQGQILGFLGPNGAGKSTTMKIATCYLPPSSGTIVVNGHDVVQDPITVRRMVGYLPEHNPLYLDMYVHEYLEFVASVYGLKGKQAKARIQEMVELCGLTLEQGKKIGALSKGYRQRVGLAQALVHDPQVLILDEPTTGLDPNQIVEIRSLIRRIGQDKTVIFSTHIMQEVTAICDRVVIINRGKLVANSDVASLQAGNRGAKLTLVEFEQPINIEQLQTIVGVEQVELVQNNTYRITSSQDADIRASVFRIAAEQNWPLVGLRQEENSLEQIFQQLTK
ncbi:gliding motility-associated ABC transporter ATP-binding subunit GldA [Pontibacter sp. BT310]|uniref:Gliding motility-associated ABC transporter ATP-binding subunit GldA n=1 Tax=Pontibacter populi TaxID=890055 RepID=A0ABS6XH46_9BACT|nr:MULTISPECIES: gliding motility-associated ABC transporter ATP-binding subunit GldA [Pontibacter]MBJ6119662.1 gliding motility-associated ABC transporter ATP-binding subunit GldA [Pontibacter sp. BT310]MBR0572091.1 gliding motility-associated ABC transporter ATP-binding subunit GldA [Microvirga sp. STS03]MBW3366515.1 gliding motility-associated ABC transporter ATP-binding subunit GldA [Pontibacter populi]